MSLSNQFSLHRLVSLSNLPPGPGLPTRPQSGLPGAPLPPARPLARPRNLSRGQLATLQAMADRFYPADGPIGVSARQVNLAQKADELIGKLIPEAQILLKVLLVIFEYAPPFFIFRFRRFSRLKPADQDAYLAKWDGHKLYGIRGGFLLFKILSSLIYYDEPEVAAAIGYNHECLRPAEEAQ